MVTRLKGNLLTISIDGDEYAAELSAVEFGSEEAADDVKAFGEENSDWFMNLSGLVSLDSASFWRACWTASGNRVAYVVRPLGNATATADAPHFTGYLFIPERGRLPLSIDSNPKSSSSFDGIRFDIDGEPTLVVA